MHPARLERQRLCDLLDEVGPAAPTMCEGWTTTEMVAHLVTRENRPDAGPGLLGRGPFAAYTQRLEAHTARRPYPELVAALRSGPPPWWPGRWLPAADLHEFFVHHEDVRRAQGLGPRTDVLLDDAIWDALANWGRILTRKADVGVVLARPDGTTRTAHEGDPEVVLAGRPTELMLELFGRSAEVDVVGEDAAVAAFRASTIGL